MKEFSFENTEVAYAYRTTKELRRALWLFRAVRIPILSNIGNKLVLLAYKLKLPTNGLIVNWLYKQFCGGETLDDVYVTAEHLMQYNVDVILDYGVEALETEEDFDKTTKQFLETINLASVKEYIPFVSIKITAIARFALLEKIHRKESCTQEEQAEWNRVVDRLDAIIEAGIRGKVKILIDAEESWIQDPIDALAYDMMVKYNQDATWVFNTYQLYRWDRLDFLREHIKAAELLGFNLGAKLVRGAYMEKERLRARLNGYESPIQMDKASTDRDFNKAILLCAKNECRVEMFIGSHNEYSCNKGVELINCFGLDPSKVYFSQLYGMSDNITFNMANAGYTCLKYLPYGPKHDTVPYLLRRAQENSSIGDQSSQEISLIKSELKRRRNFKH